MSGRPLASVPRNKNMEAAMAAAGFSTYSELSRASGASLMSVSRMARMKDRLTRKSGDWTGTTLKVAEALQVHPALLLMGDVGAVPKEKEVTEAEKLSVLAGVDPPKTPFEEVAGQEDFDFSEELISGLPKQMRDVLTGRAAGKTLEEVGKDLGVTRERVRQIEMKACRLARHRIECREARGA